MIAAGAWTLLLSLSLAQPTAAAPPLSVVAHVRDGAKADPACLREAVVGFLAGHGIPATWSTPENAGTDPVEARSGRVITVEIDLREAARAALTFADTAGSPPLLREVALQHGLDDVGCEALADVIESVVLALAAGPTDPQPEPAPAVAAPPAVAPVAALTKAPPDAAFGAGHALSLAYFLQPVAWGTAQSGIELTQAFPPRGFRQRFLLRLSYAFPVTVSADQATVRWQTLTVALGVSTSSRGRRAWLEAATWLGADWTRLERPAVSTDLTVLWATDLTCGVRVAQHAAMFASFRIAMADPITLDAGGERVFESLWAFRPTLLIGGRWL